MNPTLAAPPTAKAAARSGMVAESRPYRSITWPRIITTKPMGIDAINAFLPDVRAIATAMIMVAILMIGFFITPGEENKPPTKNIKLPNTFIARATYPNLLISIFGWSIMNKTDCRPNVVYDQ